MAISTGWLLPNEVRLVFLRFESTPHPHLQVICLHPTRFNYRTNHSQVSTPFPRTKQLNQQRNIRTVSLSHHPNKGILGYCSIDCFESSRQNVCRFKAVGNRSNQSFLGSIQVAWASMVNRGTNACATSCTKYTDIHQQPYTPRRKVEPLRHRSCRYLVVDSKYNSWIVFCIIFWDDEWSVPIFPPPTVPPLAIICGNHHLSTDILGAHDLNQSDQTWGVGLDATLYLFVDF